MTTTGTEPRVRSKPHERLTCYELVCTGCGATFTATRPDARYCSNPAASGRTGAGRGRGELDGKPPPSRSPPGRCRPTGTEHGLICAKVA